MSTPPSNAKIFQNNDTIRFAGSQITILAVGMMPDDATNMTGMSPPSYATDDVFVIYGLIDPTIVVQSGAHVNLVFVNLDDDMYHNYVVTSLAPPYSYMPMQGMMWSNSSSWYGGMMGGLGMMGGGSFNTIFANMMPVLSPTNTNQGIAYYYATTFTMNNYGGSYWYICTYPGHAESGMYGKILVGA
jgi:rusticyanin